MRRVVWGGAALAAVCVVGLPWAPAQEAVAPAPQAMPLLQSLAGTAGVTGAEEAVIAKVQAALPGWAAKAATVDHVGNLRVTAGTGEPRRVVLCHVDEIGWRVTQVTDEGYLRIASPGHTARRDIADRLLEGKQIIVQGDHGELQGAVTAQSTHLKGARPELFDLDRAWIDIGARSEAEARAMGAAELSPVAWRRIVRPIANERLTGPALGDRVGATTVLQAMHRLDPAKLRGTVVFLFAVQRWHRGYQGVGRGGEVAALDLAAEEVLGVAASVDAPLGKGAVIPTPLAASRDALPEALRDRTQVGNVEDPGLRAWTRRTQGWKVCGVPVRYRYTPVEMVDGRDLAAAADCLTHWLQGGK
jgi:endoglucanase